MLNILRIYLFVDLLILLWSGTTVPCIDSAGIENTLERQLIHLRRQISNIPSQCYSDVSQLEITVDNIIQNLKSREVTPTENEKDCGAGKICVKLHRCISSKRNKWGNIQSNFRVADHQTCSMMETCCLKTDVIDTPSQPNFLPDNPLRFAKCGTRNVNGINITLESIPNKEAQFGEFPWMVALMLKTDTGSKYLGGGSIIAPDVIMTAAHKIQPYLNSELSVRAGEWDFRSDAEPYPHINRGVNRRIVHENFTLGKGEYNIALLVLQIPLGNNPHISPICLPPSNVNFENYRCTITGWGKKTKESQDYSNILKEITVPIVSRAACSRALGMSIEATTLCAGGEENVDSCEGDGGAPLVCPIEGIADRYYQTGIASWGIGCGMRNKPAGYSNVSHLMPWIRRKLDELGIDSKYYTYNGS